MSLWLWPRISIAKIHIPYNFFFFLISNSNNNSPQNNRQKYFRIITIIVEILLKVASAPFHSPCPCVSFSAYFHYIRSAKYLQIYFVDILILCFGSRVDTEREPSTNWQLITLNNQPCATQQPQIHKNITMSHFDDDGVIWCVRNGGAKNQQKSNNQLQTTL